MTTPPESKGPPLMKQEARVQLMFELAAAVKQTGLHILEVPGNQIFNTVVRAQHQFSSIDSGGSNMLRMALNPLADALAGRIVEEADSHILRNEQELHYPLFIADAVEGSVNAKRGLKSPIRRPIHAGTSVMVLENRDLSSIVASAFYDFASGKTFSSVRGQMGSFLSFVDGHLMNPDHSLSSENDNQHYIVVPGYSNSNLDARTNVERVLMEVGFSTTGGSRSSAQDLIDIATHQVDGYVDLRALYSDGSENRDEVLHTWDVGGVLPMLSGLGLRIVVIDGHETKDWQGHAFVKPLALVVARQDLMDRILERLRALPFLQQRGEREATVKFPSTSASL